MALVVVVSVFLGKSKGSIPWFDFVFVGLFAVAGIYSAAIVYLTPSPADTHRTQDPTRLRAYRKWAWLLLGLLIIVMVITQIIPLDHSYLEIVLDLTARSFPLVFLFVNTYYLERFTFFDVFIKRGTFSFLVFTLLVIFFFGVWQVSGVVSNQLVPWILALTLLPMALFLPWMYRKLESGLDRVWLGRRFGPEEAVQYFLTGVQNATTESQLVHFAENQLSDIFRAKTTIALGSSPPATEHVLEIPIRTNGSACGFIYMGERLEGTPYFSKDVDLLSSLANVFSNMLENVRLQQKKREQEQRERELEIYASRSELKALRAQINPHFLFNALNAIAGLIHKNPGRAEETVEQLSEVFRYTLKGSEKEWARLEDEIDFARSYLDIEQARFGNRLQTLIEIDDSLRDLEIPTMVIQTVVENAVKHGVARVRGAGTISIRAFRSGNRMLIEVEDNGPGFPNESIGAEADKHRTGHGLRSIRERLHGYYGSEARLKIRRDDALGVTTVAIEVPIHEGASRH
jgi:signal transduction histidine kinase